MQDMKKTSSFIVRTDKAINGVFKFCLTLAKSKKVLTTSSSFGGVAMALTPHVRWVVCYCRTYKEALTIRKRFKEEGIRNAYVVVGRLTHLPFSDGSFNNVCLHDIGAERAWFEGSSGGIIMREISRILTAKGECYFSFMDSNAYHGFKKNSLLKLIMRNGKESLKRSSVIEYYPDLKYPYFIRITRTNVRWLKLKDIFNMARIAVLRNSCGILLQKETIGTDGRNRSLLESIRESIQEKVGFKLKDNGIVRLGTAGSVTVDFGSAIARLPQTDVGLKRCKNNYKVLKKLARLELPMNTPKCILTDYYGGQYFFVESKLKGISLDLFSIAPGQLKKIYEDAASFLISDSLRLGFMDQSSFSSLVDYEIKQLYPFLRSSERRLLEEFRIFAQDIFLEEGLPLVIQHGDFKYSNFLYEKRVGLKGVIDWDLGKIPGLPLIDFLMLRFYDLCSQKEGTFTEYVFRMINGLSIDDRIVEFADRVKIPDACLYPLLFMGLMQYVNDYWHNIEVKRTTEWYDRVVLQYLVPACSIILKLH